MPFDGSDVYQLASRLGLPDIERVAARAGVVSVLQITAYYAARRVRHTVARVIEYQSGEIEMKLVYEGVRLEKPIRLAISSDALEKVQSVLLKTRFGRLGDQADLSYEERGLWLVQQAAGTHTHGILMAPDRVEPPYSAIVNAIDAYLPEAIREAPLRS